MQFDYIADDTEQPTWSSPPQTKTRITIIDLTWSHNGQSPISVFLERLAVRRLHTHCDDHQLLPYYQSVTLPTNPMKPFNRNSIYMHRQLGSTFHWQRDNRDVCSQLVLLDLSAAFDILLITSLYSMLSIDVVHWTLVVLHCDAIMHHWPGINSASGHSPNRDLVGPTLHFRVTLRRLYSIQHGWIWRTSRILMWIWILFSLNKRCPYIRFVFFIAF